MNGSVVLTYLTDVLHAVAQGLLAPDILLLLAFIVYALFCIGSVIAERFSERRHFNVVMPKFLAALMEADEEEIPEVIKQSGLLKRQKIALLTVFDYRTLPGDALVALIKRLVDEEETRYDRITGRNNMAARVSPMLGLMGTLIPLGPGIEALGRADTTALSSSLLIAFDTTVAGLVVAAVCLIVGKIRSNWYGNYMSALDSAMATMLQKIEDMRAAGKIVIQEPSDYAFLYESSTAKPAKGSAAKTAPAKDAPTAAPEPTPASAQAPAQQRAAVETLDAVQTATLTMPAATAAPVQLESQPQLYAAEPQVMQATEVPGQDAASQSFESYAASSGAAFEPVPMPSFLDSLETAAAESFEPTPARQYAYDQPSYTVPAEPTYASQPTSYMPQFGSYEPQGAVASEPLGQTAQADVSVPAFDFDLSFGTESSVVQEPMSDQGAPAATRGWYQPRLRTDVTPADSDGGYISR